MNPPADQDSPRIWCLLGHKAGDNTQVRALAGELGWHCEEKHIAARPWELWTHLLPRPSLAGIDRRHSSALAPPWPDLVITAGRRNEQVAQWIKRHADRPVRLVHIGRPWAPLDAWDLIVTTPQYFLPQRDNVIHNPLPLLVRDGAGADAEQALLPRIRDLPHPRVAVLAGGDSGKFVFTPEKGRRLGRLANRLAQQAGGSVLLTDSPRTPAAAGDALVAELQVPRFVHRWQSGGINPYQGLLATADAFVVTGESMSMLAEAHSTGRPLYIFDMGDGETPWWHLSHAWRYKPLSHRLAMALGPRRMRRDIGRIQESLIATGSARWLDENTDMETAIGHSENPAGDSEESLRRSAEAVRRLLACGQE